VSIELPTDFEGRDELTEADKKKEEIEEELELVEENHRNESDKVVLSVVNLVVEMPLGLIASSVQEDRPFLFEI